MNLQKSFLTPLDSSLTFRPKNLLSIADRKKYFFTVQNKTEKQPSLKVSLLGIDKLFDSQSGHHRKILWFVTIMILGTVCIYHIQDRVQYFVANPVTMTNEIKENMIMELPPIMICPPALEGQLFEAWTKLRKLSPPECLQNTFSACSWDSLDVQKYYFFEELFANVTVAARSPCAQFQNETCNSFLPVNLTHVHAYLGKCIHLQSESTFHYYGSSTNVQVFVLNMSESRFSQYLVDFGFETSLYDSLPLVLDKEAYHITIRMKQYHFLDRKSNRCLHKFQDRKECVERLARKHLNCSLPFMDDRPFLKTCNSSTEILRNLMFFFGMKENFLKKCTVSKRCDDTSYTWSAVHSSSRSYNSNILLQFVYPKNTYELMTESWAYPLSSLLGDIGGHLGLFLGISLPCIVEIFDEFLQYWFTLKMTNRQTDLRKLCK